MIQARVADPTGTNKTVFAAPARDIAHCLPSLIRKAIELASNRIDRMLPDVETHARVEAELCDHVVAVAKYIKIASSDTDVDTALAGMDKAGLKRTGGAASFNEAFADVLLQVYFTSIRDALHGHEKALGVDELVKSVEERTNVERPA